MIKAQIEFRMECIRMAERSVTKQYISSGGGAYGGAGLPPYTNERFVTVRTVEEILEGAEKILAWCKKSEGSSPKKRAR